MKILNNIQLKSLNSFNISSYAKYFAEFSSEIDLLAILKHNLLAKEKLFILGGGSNILLTKNIDGLLIKNAIKGIKIIEENDNHLIAEVGAGENWHDFVKWSIKQNVSGIENLALIPGSVGAAPIQNIGAYGMEVKDTVEKVYYIDIQSLEKRTLINSECKFNYRNSIFKNDLKNKIIITKVVFKLNKKHANNYKYGVIEEELNIANQKPTLENIFNTIISIRTKKLPDPKVIGNSGSFFKNPIINNSKFNNLKKKYPDIIGYTSGKNQIKIAAGWLIEKAGWKGYTCGDAGVHKNQALVLVNYENASGKEILDLSKKIQKSILEKFEIIILPEVNII